MSTCFSASVLFGYALSEDELTIQTPHPLWGKAKFDPNTGHKVTQFIESEVKLPGLPYSGEELPHWKAFKREDRGDTVLLGVVLGETDDLNYGGCEPILLPPLTETTRAKVELEVRKLLDKAGIAFDPGKMGYWLAGYVY
jgi:hypothetical protein